MSDISKRIEALTPAQRDLLAQKLKAMREQEGGATREGIKRRDPSEPARLSFAQHRLWFLDQLQPGNNAYNMPLAVRLVGPLDVEAMRRTLSELVRRHETLRTSFVSRAGEPEQVIWDAGELELPLVDLSAVEDPLGEARSRVAEQSHRPFDLAAGPLCRVTLMRLGDEDHVLALTLHHIISDGWSMSVLQREFLQLYEAFRGGGPSPLPELPIQYADFAAWQREWLTGRVLDEQLDYWREQLRGAPPVLELPTDRPRPLVQTFAGRVEKFTLSQETFTALQEISRREGATLFMTLLAAFDVLLWRYTGQTDIVVGSPIAERARVETEAMIGFFVNTLVLRTKLDGDPSFVELLGRVRETCLGAYAHQDVPFERLLAEDSEAERSFSHSPLFQVMFVQHPRNSGVDLPPLPSGLRMERMGSDTTASKFDLTLFLEEAPGEGLVGSFEYNTDLFDADTIGRMTSHFRQVLLGIVASPDAPISGLPLLTDGERRQILDGWNDTRRDYPKDVCVHELIARQAARTPDAAAVECGGESITYRELDERANRLARYLRGRGVGAETPVALMMERSIELMVTLLGILKSGGAYVPLDPGHPQERLRWMLEDTGAPLVLTQESLARSVPSGISEVVVLADEWGRVERESAAAPDWPSSSGQTAYVIYTSGSTGRPKGVMVHHRALVNFVEAAGEVYHFAEGERVLQFLTVSFDGSAEEIYPALTRGATLVLRNDSMIGMISLFLRTVREWGINVLDLPTAFWHEVVARMESEGLELPASVRLVIIGGEKSLESRLTTWKRLVGGGVRLVNTYGPTETTVIATTFDTAEMRENALGEVPIGRPIGNARVYILDRRMNPVPPRVTGEVYIGGECVARGYLNRPELTAEKFIPDPFSPEPGGRLYRTGDLARYLPDGVIEFMGRLDNQVKIRGFRVELSEVETALNSHPAVEEALVVVREDTPGERRVVAYVVAGGDEPPTVIELRHHLEERLAHYMVPTGWVMLDALPMLPSGKVDHQALPALDQFGATGAAYVAPRDQTETALAEIWQEVLGLERVGVNDSFFDLGGHSLLATQIIARIHEAFGLELPLRKLFETPTIAEIGVALAEMRGEGGDDEAGGGGAEAGNLPDALMAEPFFDAGLLAREPLLD